MLSTNVLWRDRFLLQEVLPFQNLNLKVPPTPEETLNAIEIVYRQAQAALSKFLEKKLPEFDAVVGDELCEARTYLMILAAGQNIQEELEMARRACDEKLSLVAQARFALKESEAQLKAAISSKKEILAGMSTRNEEICKVLFAKKELAPGEELLKLQEEFESIKKGKEPIKEAIKSIQQDHLNQAYQIVSNPKLDVKLSGKMDLIIKAYLLTKIKKEEIDVKPTGACCLQDKTLVTKLGVNGLKCPTVIFEAAIPLLKKSVVSFTADFLEQEAQCMKMGREIFLKVFSKRRFVKKKGHEEVPFYYALRLIYLRAMEEQIPIVFKVRNVMRNPPTGTAFVCRAMFKAEPSKGTPGYALAKVSNEDLLKPAIIVEAYSSQCEDKLKQPEYLLNFLKESGGLFNYLTELDSSQHSQYTDQPKSMDGSFDDIPGLPAEEKARLTCWKKEAKLKGFTMDNCSQGCVEHVFADLIGNQMNAMIGSEE